MLISEVNPHANGVNVADEVLCTIEDNIATIMLHRPDNGNAIDLALGKALAAVINRVAADSSVRALLISGTGKAFCVGGDIAEMLQVASLPEFLEPALAVLHAAVHKLGELPVPVVTAINGPVGGGGIGLALCGDFVLASESMKLRGGYSAIGLTPDLGASWYLARRAGPARAKQILFLNKTVSARECLDLGLVDAVYPQQDLEREAQALVRRLAASATLSLKRIKHLVDGAATRSFQQHLDLEARTMVASAGSEDAHEGIRAFIEKREPEFRGR
jgi:2-(1,2-epoxy-1,2-dihydrophenyl)acetyl-CoA isomerase